MKKAPTFHRRLRRRLNFSQNFRKPRAFGARTPLLGAFGPQKWEYPPPPSRKKIWETTRKNRPEQGFHSGGKNWQILTDPFPGSVKFLRITKSLIDNFEEYRNYSFSNNIHSKWSSFSPAQQTKVQIKFVKNRGNIGTSHSTGAGSRTK